LVKKPSFRPTRAEAWVMFVRKPSLTVTGAVLATEFAVAPEEVVLEEEDEEQPASRRAAPIIAAVVTRRI
jgi:hypothetical protein